MRNIFISIIDFNGKKNTIECLDAIDAIRIKNFRLNVVVIDNASKIEFSLNKRFRNFPFKLIRNKENLGFAEGNNVGIRYALEHGADYVLVLNNDTLVEENLIEELLKVANIYENIGILAPKIYFASGFEFHKNRYSNKDLGKVFWYAGGESDWKNVIGHHRGVDEVDHGQYDKIMETQFASGCCMFIKKAVFDKVGLFDNKYFLYYEDADFSERVKKANYKIVYVPKAILWHKNAGSAGGSGSKLQDYYITRNRLLFGARYAPPRAKLALIKESFLIFLKGRYWQRRGVLDFYLNKFGKGSFNP